MFGMCPEPQGAFEIRASKEGIFVECFQVLGKIDLDMMLSGLLLAEEKVRGYNQEKQEKPIDDFEKIFELQPEK
jgi:hypothetical protein